MHKEDEEFLERVRHEQQKYGLELEDQLDEGKFQKIMKRLIEEPPNPKQRKAKHTIGRTATGATKRRVAKR